MKIVEEIISGQKAYYCVDDNNQRIKFSQCIDKLSENDIFIQGEMAIKLYQMQYNLKGYNKEQSCFAVGFYSAEYDAIFFDYDFENDTFIGGINICHIDDVLCLLERIKHYESTSK